MALNNLYAWVQEESVSAACGAACGASDKPAEEAPAACGAADEAPAACGAADKSEEVPAACGAADKAEETPAAACGSACGASDNK